MTSIARVPNRVWTDAFGSAICTVEGGYGGRAVLVVVGLGTGPKLAEQALEQLLGLPHFKGRVGLAVLTELHAAPITNAIRQLEASAVISFEDVVGVITHGPGLNAQAGSFTSTTGLDYVESGNYAAWDAGWLKAKLEGLHALASVTASTASGLGLASAVCGVHDLEKTLLLALS